MILLTGYDYVAYITGYYYVKITDRDDLRDFSGAMFVSMFQFFNILALIGTRKYFNLLNIDTSISIILGLSILGTFNAIRYCKYMKHEINERRWSKEKDKNIFLKKLFVFSYMVISVVLLGLRT